MRSGYHPRVQGDFGELSAMQWLTWAGAEVSKPVFHSSFYDLIADFDGTLLRVEVKTSNCQVGNRFQLSVVTNGMRAIPGVRTTETFVYLKLAKQTYTWGTR